MAPLPVILAITFASLLLHAEAFIRDEESPNDVLKYIQEKRASNLGGRLDSRNCAAFNVGKKFVGYSWLRGGDMRQRRDYLYYKNFPGLHKYEVFRETPRTPFNLKY